MVEVVMVVSILEILVTKLARTILLTISMSVLCSLLPTTSMYY